MDINVNINVKIENMDKLIDAINGVSIKGKEVCTQITHKGPATVKAEVIEPVKVIEESNTEIQGQTTFLPTTAVVESYAQDQIAKGMATVMEMGKRDIINNILQAFNAKSLMDIAQENYGRIATILREAGVKI